MKKKDDKKLKFQSNSNIPNKTVKYWWKLEGDDKEKFIQKSRWDLQLEDRQYKE